MSIRVSYAFSDDEDVIHEIEHEYPDVMTDETLTTIMRLTADQIELATGWFFRGMSAWVYENGAYGGSYGDELLSFTDLPFKPVAL